ncbi:MAG: hypothetical protein H0U95_10350 [Bacteroidetes bacterium]|nr:hypothetical protein [Bacteroidota bacterium]
MKKQQNINWYKKPEEHNYPAAQSYLSLLLEIDNSKKIVKKLRMAKISEYKAKDIFRASSLSLLGISNSHVEKDVHKIKAGDKLSPILLVRNTTNSKVIIADGYHRLCAVYAFDEDAIIPCKIV